MAERLPDGAWRGRNGLDRLLAALDADRGATRFVGGAVRDTLLDLPVYDIDLATRLRPDEVAARIRDAGLKAVPTGIAHGTVTAVLPDGPVEVTTLRRDVATDGRHATVAYSDDWREDAARRDFTINALSADPASGALFDYFGGLADLKERTVRFIGDPLQRIAEDHLRVLRFFRFHARFGRDLPDPAALAACAARANDLMALSRERIADELLKLLGVADPAPTIALMLDRAILAPVLPEIDAAGGERLARTVRRETALGIPAAPLRRLAALLPDAAAAAAAGARLKLSKAARKRLALAATPPAADDILARAFFSGAEAALDQLLLSDAADAAVAAAWRRLDGWQRPRLAVGGGALVAMGLASGPTVAATLQAIERQWVAEGFPGEARTRAIAEAAVAQALREAR